MPSTASSAATPPDEFFKAAVFGAGIAIVGLDTFGHVTLLNPAAARFFGRSQEQLVSQPLEVLVPPEFRPVASRALQRTLQQRSVNNFEFALVPPGGKHPIYVGVILNCVTDAAGEVRGVMAWMRDISNRKELENNLTRTRHMASLGTLAAGVAHQFNNIACGMSTSVEMALRDGDPGAISNALQASLDAANRIAYITQCLMACASPEACAMDQDYSDLTEELLRFADLVEETLRQKGIRLEVDLQATRIAAVPRNRIRLVLQHLLRNAEESLADVAVDRPHTITLRTLSQEDQIMLQFADTGGGIEPDHLPQIFDPFFTTKGVQGGGCGSNPGLGLTLVHGVVMDLGGHIWADSVVGQGTTIHILIPIVV